MNNKSEKIWAVVPAGGAGVRMGASVAKQYLTLAGRPILAHTLDRLSAYTDISGIVVGMQESDRGREIVNAFRDQIKAVVMPGAERMHTVLNCLQQLANWASDDDWVLVHDAARPLVREQEINNLVQQVRLCKADGGLLAVRITETVKRSDNKNKVTATIPRADLWLAQTPQLFRHGELTQALEFINRSNRLVTDETKAMEAAGYQPLIVEGSRFNLKITTPEDLRLAEIYLDQQK